MSYQRSKQNITSYRQTRTTNPTNQYSEEYQYEEYVHRGTGQPGSYKREVRYVKNGPNQNYDDRNMQSAKFSKQVVTTVSRTTENKNIKNQPRNFPQRDYKNSNAVYEVKGVSRVQNLPDKNAKKGYSSSPSTNFPQRGNNYNQNKFASNTNNQTTQKLYSAKNYNSNISPQQKNARTMNITSGTKNTQNAPKTYSFQRNFQSTSKNSNSLPKYSNISKDFKKDNIKQTRKNNYTPNKNVEYDGPRKIEILKAEKRIRKTYNDAPNPNKKQNSFDTSINHNIYEIKQVTKEVKTVAEDPNNININFHRYSYGKPDPNIVNTVNHTIDETSKVPKKQKQVSPRKEEVIKAVKRYRKTYNDSSTGDINQNQSYNAKSNRPKNFSFNNPKNQYNRGGSNPKNSQKNQLANTYSFNKNTNTNTNNTNLNRYKNNYTSGNNNTTTNKYSFQSSQITKTTYTQKSNLRSNDKKDQNKNKVSQDDDPNKKINAVVYSKKDPISTSTQDQKKNVTTKSYMQSTTTTTTTKPNLAGKGFVVSTEMQKVTKTTDEDGKIKHTVQVKKEEKIKNDEKLEDGEEGEAEEGIEDGQEEVEGEEGEEGEEAES